jgi:hypothetical protein
MAAAGQGPRERVGGTLPAMRGRIDTELRPIDYFSINFLVAQVSRLCDVG